MRAPDRLKPAKSGIPFLVGGVAAVFVVVASQSLHWSAASTIVVGLALAVLLAAVGPPLALLPAEMAQERMAATAAEEGLRTALADAVTLHNELWAEHAERLAAERARFDGRIAEERARFEERLEQERERSDAQIQRLQGLVIASGATRSRRRAELLHRQRLVERYVWLGGAPVPERTQEPTEVVDWRRLAALVNADDDLPAPPNRVWDVRNAIGPDTVELESGSLRGAVLHETLPGTRYAKVRMHIEDQEEVAN